MVPARSYPPYTTLDNNPLDARADGLPYPTRGGRPVPGPDTCTIHPRGTEQKRHLVTSLEEHGERRPTSNKKTKVMHEVVQKS